MESKRISSEKKAVEAYLASHKLQEALNTAVNSTLREKPEDPFLMISDLLLEHSLSANGVLDFAAHKTYDEEMRPSLRVTLRTRYGKCALDVPKFAEVAVEAVEDAEKLEGAEDMDETKADVVAEDDTGVDAALQLLNGSIKAALLGVDPLKDEDVDLLIQDICLQHGTAIPPRLSFALSASFAIAAAQIRKIPLCKHLCQKAMGESMTLPVPAVTVLKAQQTEVWKSVSVLPTGANSFGHAVAMAFAIRERIEGCAEMSKGMSLVEACELVWDEGVVALGLQGKIKLGLTLDVDRLVVDADAEEGLESETKAEGEQSSENVDAHSIEYVVNGETTLSGEDIFECLNELITDKLAGNIAAITNPFARGESKLFKKLQIAVGEKACVYCTHLRESDDEAKLQGGLILRIEDFNTVTQLMEKRLVAMGNALGAAFSTLHESFSNSSIMPALAVGMSTGVLFLDFSIEACRTIVNELVMLEDELDAQALYIGGAFRECHNT